MTAGEDARIPAAGKVTGYTLMLNFLPLAYLSLGVVAVWRMEATSAQWGMALAWIYLVPPVVCRLTLFFLGFPHARAARQDTRAYKIWWFLTQWQVVFNRLPWLEELLRLVPGLYATWLNLWGARVSALAYWGPGSRIIDRYLLQIERGAVIGTQVSMSGHLGTIAEDGTFVVDIAPVTVCEGAIVGALAGLAPGCRVGPHELVPAGRLLQPFSAFQRGRKVKDGAMPA